MRTKRVSRLLIQVISEVVFKEVKDPRVKNVTVSDVTMSRDLKNARVYVEVFGGDITEVLEGLNKAAGFIQMRIAQTLKLKFTPKITFYKDTSFDNAQRIEKILKEEREK